MASQLSTAEAITGWITELLQDELRASSCFEANLPGIPSIKKTRLSTYKLKDMSSMFVRNGMKSKTQKMPRRTGIEVAPLVPGASVNTSTRTITEINVSLDTIAGGAVEVNGFDKNFFNLPTGEQADIMSTIARGAIEYLHKDIFNLATSATQATYAGSNLGGASTIMSPDLYRKLKENITTDKHSTSEPLYNICYPSQADWLAFSDLGGTANRSPYNDLGERGMKEYSSGDVLDEIGRIKTCTSGLVIDGSVSTSTYNMFIVGENKIGCAFNVPAGGFEFYNDKTRVGSPMIVKYEFEFNTFLLDSRCVYKYEAKKSP